MSRYRIESLLSARQFVHPQVVGDRLYFISDLSGRLSLYVMDVRGSVPEPLLPPDIALPNPHHLDSAVAFQVLPTQGQILLMLDRDGDENYQPMFLPIEGGIPQPVFGDRFAGQQLFCSFCDPDRLLALFTVDPRNSPIYSTFRADLGTLETVDLGSSIYSNAPTGHNAGMTTTLLSDQYTFGDSVLYLWREGEGERRLLFGTPIDQRAPGEQTPPNGLGATHPTERGVLFTSSLFDDAYGLSYFPWDDPAAVQPVAIEGLVHSGVGELEILRHRAGQRFT
ncbi:MAG TPA: S9 family peptidase, partial [Anaerolineae bacterium]|nr:S9 family peptidase [Anaerolineae bacterium]